MTDIKSTFKIAPFPRRQEGLKPAQKVVVITDGGCEPNPGTGGWGALVKRDNDVQELYGGKIETTNQQMEITAAIMGLRALGEPCEVEVISDSQYVVYTMTKGWKRRANKELWEQLDEAAAPHKVTWTWVRGHDGHKGNERAHVLADQGMKDAQAASEKKSRSSDLS